MFLPGQGVMQMKKTDLNPHYVFIKPPSMEELEKRLRGRNTENEDSIQVSLANFKLFRPVINSAS
jgi:guanylate kinase